MYTSKIFVTVDAVVIANNNASYSVLLIKRKNDPFKDYWALPGGFVDENEDLKSAAIRELYEETTVAVSDMTQIGAFGTPFRDPRSHVVSVAYYIELAQEVHAAAQDDAKEIGWFSINDLPLLAFDHQNIIQAALNKFLNESYI